MSLIRPIIRWTAIAALRNNTWAESRILDSSNTPLVDMLTAEVPEPFIVVYTDADTRNVNGRDVLAADRSLSLVLEIGLASGVLAEDKLSRIIQVPATDEGKEVAVDIIETQAIEALLGKPTSPWCELFKNLVVNIHRAPSMRGGAVERGTRWAARQLTFVCQPVADLLPSDVPDPDHPVSTFLALARSDEAAGLRDAADLIQKMIGTTPMSDWRTVQAHLAYTNYAIRAIGLAPIVTIDDAHSGLTEVKPDEPDPSLTFDEPATDATEYADAYNEPV